VTPPGAPGDPHIVYTDGAARGNPGPAGAGALVLDAEGRRVAEVDEYLGEATNNVAEYRALLLGLACAREVGAREIEVRADSELLVKQMNGEYRVRSPQLLVLHRRARRLERAFESVAYVHVRRAANTDADRLANRAIDLGSEPTDVQNAPSTGTKLR
jgi:ribonuclease HI